MSAPRANNSTESDETKAKQQQITYSSASFVFWQRVDGARGQLTGGGEAHVIVSNGQRATSNGQLPWLKKVRLAPEQLDPETEKGYSTHTHRHRLAHTHTHMQLTLVEHL